MRDGTTVRHYDGVDWTTLGGLEEYGVRYDGSGPFGRSMGPAYLLAQRNADDSNVLLTPDGGGWVEILSLNAPVNHASFLTPDDLDIVAIWNGPVRLENGRWNMGYREGGSTISTDGAGNAIAGASGVNGYLRFFSTCEVR